MRPAGFHYHTSPAMAKPAAQQQQQQQRQLASLLSEPSLVPIPVQQPGYPMRTIPSMTFSSHATDFLMQVSARPSSRERRGAALPAALRPPPSCSRSPTPAKTLPSTLQEGSEWMNDTWGEVGAGFSLPPVLRQHMPAPASKADDLPLHLDLSVFD